MDELHENEQYFFSDESLKYFGDLVDRYASPCLLCAPTLGVEMHKRKKKARVLDVDTRFSFLPGFKKWDIWRPEKLEETFDFLLVDPPFSIVTLDQLFNAIRILSKSDFSIPLVITNHQARVFDVESVFGPFGVRLTDYKPTYKTATTRCVAFSNVELSGETSDSKDSNVREAGQGRAAGSR